MLEIKIVNDAISYDDICNFIEFHDFNSWRDKISEDKSKFGEEDDKFSKVVFYDDDLLKNEIIEFVEYLASWLTRGVIITAKADWGSVKVTKTLNGHILSEIQ